MSELPDPYQLSEEFAELELQLLREALDARRRRDWHGPLCRCRSCPPWAELADRIKATPENLTADPVDLEPFI